MGSQQQCFAAIRASASRVCFARYRGIPNDRSGVLSAAGVADFGAGRSRGCVRDGRTFVRADAAGRLVRHDQSRPGENRSVHRVDHEFQSSSRPAHSDVAAIGPFDQGSPLCNQISHRPPFGRLSEKVDIQSDSPLCKRAHHHSTRRPWFEISRYID